MQHDAQDLAISAASASAAAAFDAAVCSYLGYRADAAQRLEASIAADPGFGLGHCIKGCLVMLTYKQANVAVASQRAPWR